MNDTEKRALFCRIDSKLMQGMDRMAANVMVPATDLQSLRRLAAAVPPKGYVLVPVELTHEMYCAFVEQWFTKVRAIDDTEMEDCYAALLAARPEVAP